MHESSSHTSYLDPLSFLLSQQLLSAYLALTTIQCRNGSTTTRCSLTRPRPRTYRTPPRVLGSRRDEVHETSQCKGCGLKLKDLVAKCLLPELSLQPSKPTGASTLTEAGYAASSTSGTDEGSTAYSTTTSIPTDAQPPKVPPTVGSLLPLVASHPFFDDKEMMPCLPWPLR